VLVHCYAGVSRSVTIAVSYLMSTRHLDFKEAMALVKMRRPCAGPNLGFIRQLKDHERKLGLAKPMTLKIHFDHE
jgi:protein-tyrosine phosphatase